MTIAELGLRDWHNQTTVHPIGLAAALLLAAAVLQLPRRYAIVPLLIMACFVPVSQRVVLAGLDFHFIRILVVAGWVRLLIRRELGTLRWKPIDGIVVPWVCVSSIIFTLHAMSSEALINRLGHVFDGVGMYVLFRVLVRDARDIATVARSMALLAVPVACAFMIERATGRNFFSIFGGVPEYTTVRQGTLRCQGAFSHPILAGCFWATSVPLMLMLLARKRSDWHLASVGLVCAIAVIVLCASSTPIGGLAVALLAMCLFVARLYVAWFKWLAALALIGLQLAMIQPIWHLLARVSFVSGSTSYYRFRLFDEFVAHIDEWFVAGTRNIEHWWGYANGDMTNQYVLEGVHGGFIGLLLFVLMIATGFRTIGSICGKLRPQRERCIVPWALGCCLLTHSAVFWGVSYFGQIEMIWYLLLAMIASMSSVRGTIVLRVRAVRMSTPPTLSTRGFQAAMS